MRSAPVFIQTSSGMFAVEDFGGTGRDVLFVHGTGHNLEVWRPLVACLKGQCRMAAFDMRGHGQTPVNSQDAQQYWRDIGAVASAMGLERPLLVGHSAGGYAVTAFAADGGDCAGIVVLDGFVLDDRKTPDEAKGWYLPKEQLWALFRYGWTTSKEEMARYVEEVCRTAPEDWLNAGIDPAVVAAFTRRAFLVDAQGSCLRRPTMEEVAVVSVPEPAAEIYPSLDLYERLSVPAGFVLAANGLYGNREQAVLAVVRARTNRRFLKLDGGHNVHMHKPDEVARFISAFCREMA